MKFLRLLTILVLFISARSMAGSYVRTHCSSKNGKFAIDFGHTGLFYYLADAFSEVPHVNVKLDGKTYEVKREAIQQYYYDSARLDMIIDAVQLGSGPNKAVVIRAQNGRGQSAYYLHKTEVGGDEISCEEYQGLPRPL